MMNIRRITSLTVLVSFVLEILTSVILYITPHGRVAYWSDWHLWGLSKTQWGDLHINLGVLFLLAGALHIYYNFRPIMTYLKNRAKQLVILTREFNAALIITLVFILGTYFMIPPFSTVLTISENIKNAASVRYGEPPFGHAELSPLSAVIKKSGLDMDSSLDALAAAGITFTGPDEIFLDIARKNGMSPQALFARISTKGGQQVSMPELPTPGTGNKTLAQICEAYGLPEKQVVEFLSGKGYRIAPDRTIKELAGENQISAVELYDLIRSTVQTPGS